MKTEDKINEDINLKELIQNIKKLMTFWVLKWRIILAFCVLGLSIGFLYGKYNKPDYTAKLTFALENNKQMILGSSLISNLGFDVGGSNENGVFGQSNIIELFKSRRIIEKSLLQTINLNNKTMTLAELYLTNHKSGNYSREANYFKSNQKRTDFSEIQNSLVFNIYCDLVNDQLKINILNSSTSIINIELTSKNEMFSKYFLDALVKVVSNDYYDFKIKKLNINTNNLENLVDSVRFELKNLIRNNLNEAIPENNSYEIEKQINIKILSDVLSDLSKQLELSKGSISRGMSLIQVIDPPIFPLEKKEISWAKGSIYGLIYGLTFIVIFLTFKQIIRKFLI